MPFAPPPLIARLSAPTTQKKVRMIHSNIKSSVPLLAESSLHSEKKQSRL